MISSPFLYFDLGNVLVTFSTERMFRQMGDVAGIKPAVVKAVVVEAGLQRKLESGEITSRQFHDTFCERTGAQVDYDTLVEAGSDIFELNLSMLPVVTSLQQGGYRLGVLSNTCEHHWEHCTRRFRIVGEMFSVHALSCRIGAMKPDAAVFRAAAELAGCAAEEIFFVDDLAQHVAGAQAAGFDAVQYTTTAALVAELRRRGVEFNY